MTNFSKPTLVCFATSNFSRSRRRFLNQAEKTGWYEDILDYDEVSLAKIIRQNYDEFVSGRGYGYWKWKPVIVYDALKHIPEGRLLHYCDVGCFLRTQGSSRFSEYVNLLNHHDALFFETSPVLLPDELPRNRNFPSGIEEQWTKQGIFDFFNVEQDDKIRKTPAFGATTFFVKKNSRTMEFFSKYEELALLKPNLFNDDVSGSQNSPLIMPRHDQSILSVLLKLEKLMQFTKLSSFENWFPSIDGTHTDWKAIRRSPIWIKRDRSNTILGLLNQKIKAVPRVLKRKIQLRYANKR